MTITIGDKLPTVTLRRVGLSGPEPVTVEDLLAGKKAVLFGVPRAFTSVCSRNHLPGYLHNLDRLAARGFDTVAVVAVNDPFVMEAWADATGGRGKIEYLSDGNGEFTKAIGLDLDASGLGLGTRSQRYAMVVYDMKITYLAVEESPAEAGVSSAEALLDHL